MATGNTNRLFYFALLLLYKILFFGIIHLLELKYSGNDTEFAENQTELIAGNDPIASLDRDIPDPIPIAEDITLLQNAHVHIQRDTSYGSEDNVASLNRKLIHRKKVKFMNPAIRFLFSLQTERIGLFAQSEIEFGSVLSMEYPLVDFTNSVKNGWDISTIIKKVEKMYKKDPEFKRVWENLPVHEDIKQAIKHLIREYSKAQVEPDQLETALDHNARLEFHKIPAHHTAIVYSVIGRVRFDLPPNAMIVVSDKESGYKAALIATRTIPKDEEIVVDHFMDWIGLSADSLTDRQLWCKERGFDFNDEWMSFMEKLQDQSEMEQRDRVLELLELYPNGMIGKNPDATFRFLPSCEWGLSSERCSQKLKLKEAIESGSIFDEKSMSDQSENEYTLNAFGYDPDTVNERKLVFHPRFTHFIHSALKLQHFGDDKQYGIITTKNIPFGSVLVVEYPLVMIKTDLLQERLESDDADTVIESLMEVVDDIAEKESKRDRHFDQIWNKELNANKLIFKSWSEWFVDRKKKIPSDRVLMNWAKFNAHWLGSLTGNRPSAVYSVLSRINHGIPQNVAAIFGHEKDGFGLMLIATRDLEEGEELCLNYLQNHAPDENEWIKQNQVPAFNWIWTDELRQLIQKMNGPSAPSFSESEGKRFVHDNLFSNGIRGKQSGHKLQVLDGQCGDWMTKKDCQTTKAIKRDVDSGKVFRLLREESPAPKWMGEELVGRTARNLCYTQT